MIIFLLWHVLYSKLLFLFVTSATSNFFINKFIIFVYKYMYGNKIFACRHCMAYYSKMLLNLHCDQLSITQKRCLIFNFFFWITLSYDVMAEKAKTVWRRYWNKKQLICYFFLIIISKLCKSWEILKTNLIVRILLPLTK